MLPLAPCTRPEVPARRGNAVDGSIYDLVHYARDHPPPSPAVPRDSRNYALARNPPEYVDPPFLEVGKTVAERAYLVEEGQLGQFRVVGRRSVRRSPDRL